MMEQRLIPAGIARPHPAAVWVVCECTRVCAQKSDPSLRKHLARLVHLFRVWKLHRNLIWHIPQRQRVLVPGLADSAPRGVAGPAPPCSWMDLLPWRILCDAFCFKKLYHGETTFIFPHFCVSCSSTLWGRGLQFWKMYFIWSTRKRFRTLSSYITLLWGSKDHVYMRMGWRDFLNVSRYNPVILTKKDRSTPLRSSRMITWVEQNGKRGEKRKHYSKSSLNIISRFCDFKQNDI